MAEEDKLRQNRLSEQAALILTMKEIWSKINKDGITANKKIYKNFIPIRYDNVSNTPTGHSFLTSNFTKTPSMNYFFSSLPPQVLSLLIPSIKIYKTFFPFAKENDKKMIGYDWRVPFDNLPMNFNLDKEASEFVVTDIDKVLNGNGGLRNAAIKSFSYEYKGVNPAEINTNIQAKLQLFFQSPFELVKRIEFDLTDTRFVNRPSDAANSDTLLTFAYSDLINQSSKTIRDQATGISRPDDLYYRLKIECGYSDIQPSILHDVLENAGYDLNARNDIINAIKSTKVVLFVSPYEYNVNFNEDSTVILDINFNASLDTIMVSDEADIFKLTPDSRKLNQIIKDFKDYLDLTAKEQKLEQQETEQNYKCLDIGQIQNSIEEFKKKYNLTSDSDEDIKRKLSEERAKAYNSLSEFLIGKVNLYTEPAPNPEIAKSLIPPQVYVARFKGEILGVSSEDEKESTKERLTAFKEGNQLQSVSAQFYVDTTIADKFPTSEKDKPADLVKNPIKNVNNRSELSSKKGDNNTYNINFILLGDVLDIALNCLNDIKPIQDSPKVIIGGIPINIPSNLSEIKEAGNNILIEMQEIFPNLADIPISYNLFQEFLIKNIVEANKTRYPLLQFIKDIVSQLLRPAILPSVFGQKAVINSPLRISTSYFTFPSVKGADIIANGNASIRNYLSPINEETEKRLNDYKNGKGVVVFNDEPTEDFNSNFLNYIIFYCSAKFPKKKNVDEEDDIKKGIFHIRMGTDTGIIKKINFSKVDIPYQREMLAHVEGNHQGTNLKQFYNAQIEMFGNDIFRPGDYVYVHPNYSFIQKQKNEDNNSGNMGGFGGMEARASLAEKKILRKLRSGSQYIDLTESLGIGGYYLVIDVKTEISDFKYTTMLKCSFQAQKIGDKVVSIHDRCSDK